MNQAVREHLESDVPVGVFLSGGLDSTIMARLAAKYTDQLRTFTVGFADNPDLSESTVAAETARLIAPNTTTFKFSVIVPSRPASIGCSRSIDPRSMG